MTIFRKSTACSSDMSNKNVPWVGNAPVEKGWILTRAQQGDAAISTYHSKLQPALVLNIAESLPVPTFAQILAPTHW